MTKRDPCEEGFHRKPRRKLYDARGIFIGYLCDACEARMRARYRPEVLSDPNYEASEPIDEE